MTYQKTLDWLFTQLPMYQRQGGAAYKANLNTSIALDNLFDNPHNNFPTVHIAGTNGKGSTAHFIASILQENGYKVGLHTSPHYFDFRERIKINGEFISEDEVIEFVRRFRNFKSDLEPSFFELTVLMAFDYFQKEDVDIAIIETGMGGRLDTTNILSPLLSVITNIGLDHTQFLGDTIPKIAVEKAGIIKKETPIVLGEMDLNAIEIMMTVSENMDAPVHFSSPVDHSFNLPKYQLENIATAVTAVDVLKNKGWKVDDHTIVTGIEKVYDNTYYIGRWQQVHDAPKIILDSAHNAAGILSLLENVDVEAYPKINIVFGMVDDKDPASVLDLLPKNANYYFTEANIPRAKKVNKLISEAKEFGLIGSPFSSVSSAFDKARNDASKKDLILVFGSIFIVGEVLQHIQ